MTSRYLAGLFLFIAASALAVEDVDIREWEVPYEQSRPRDPYAASESSVWFVGQRTGYLAHLDTESGEFRQVELKSGSGPHNLIVGSDGIVWYAGSGAGVCVRIQAFFLGGSGQPCRRLPLAHAN